MLFRVALAYKATGTLKGRKNETENNHWEYVEVDIPVYSEDLAPVAVTWSDRVPEQMENYNDKRNWSSLKRKDADGREIHEGALYATEDGEHMTRLVDGDHFIRANQYVGQDEFAVRMTPDVLAAALDGNPPSPVFGQGYIRSDRLGEEMPALDTDYRRDRPFSSTFSEEKAKLASAASEFMIVDGEIFRRSSEPVVIIVTYATKDDGIAMMPRVLPREYTTDRDTVRNVASYDEVLAECVEFAGPRGPRFGRRHVPELGPPPQIHIDGATVIDEHTENFVAAARKWAGDGVGDHTRLKDCDPDFGMAYLALRKAVTLYALTGDVDPIETAAHRLVTEFPGEIRWGNLVHAYNNYAERPVSVDRTAGPAYGRK